MAAAEEKGPQCTWQRGSGSLVSAGVELRLNIDTVSRAKGCSAVCSLAEEPEAASDFAMLSSRSSGTFVNDFAGTDVSCEVSRRLYVQS